MEIFAHRGLSGTFPENSLLALQSALKYTMKVEFDVQLCKTGEVVLMHDRTVNRTAIEGQGYVADLTLAELQEVHLGLGQVVPTLGQALDCLAGAVQVNIELKGPGTAGPVAEIIQDQILQKSWQPSNFIVSSFDHPELERFMRRLPNIPTAALICGVPFLLAEFAVVLGVQAVHPNVNFITEEFVKNAHARGLLVRVYTVNDEPDFQQLHKWKVDGIFTDFPDRIKS